MINILREFKTSKEQICLKQQLFYLDNECICDECHVLIRFDDEDINRDKMLPHIVCPKCNRLIQLHKKYCKPSICDECYECHYYWQNNDTEIQCDGNSKCCCEFYRR